MEVILKNIGVIKDSTINLNGVTVITGKNNSGKTTVGKVLYAIIAAVDRLVDNAVEDKSVYALSILEDALNTLGLSRILNGHRMTTISEFPVSRQILSRDVSFNNLEELLASIDDFQKEIRNIQKEDIYNFSRETDSHNLSEDALNNLWNNINQNMDLVLNMVDKLKATLLQDPNLVSYANSKIIRHLLGELASQIAPIRLKGTVESKIVVKSQSVKYYDITLINQEIANQEATFFVNCYDKCWFIDDINVIDQMAMNVQFNASEFFKRRFFAKHHSEISYTEFAQLIGGQSHRAVLLDGLTKSINEYERSIHEEETKSIFDLLSREVKSDIVYSDGEYWCADDKLNVRNLASGAKLILILKLLLENGCIDSKSLIILDEPENHLHPDWINLVAEAVVLIQKELGATVLVTTHNPNFLLALETMAKKYQMNDKFSIYVSEKMEDNYMVNLRNVTDNIEAAFSHLAKPYLFMDAQRYSFEDEDD